MKVHKILIAVDDTKYAQHAAEFGFDLAHSYKAEVGLVSIVEPIIYPVSGTDAMTGIPMEGGANIDEVAMLKIQSELAVNLMQQTTKQLAGDLQVTHFTEYGLTGDNILKCGKEFNADLIVVGTHSRTGLNRLFMGSVAEHLVRHSNVPVVVVPLKEGNETVVDG